jgi:hypothetical protein
MDIVPTNGWQIVQDAGGLTLLLSDVRSSFPDEVLVEEIQKVLTKVGVIVPPVSVRRVEAIPKGANGKAPLIKSNVSHLSPNEQVQRLANVGGAE